MNESSFTGRARKRTTAPGVRVVDRLARAVITVGGIGTILAVLCVALFLIWVVLPLFLPAEIDDIRAFEQDWSEPPVHVALDDYGMLAWTLFRSGEVTVYRVDDGSVRAHFAAFPAGRLRSWSFSPNGEEAIFGLADGTVQLAEIGFTTEILQADNLPADVARALQGVPDDGVANLGASLIQRIAGGQVRRQSLNIVFGEILRVGAGKVTAVARGTTPSGPRVAAYVEAPGAESAMPEDTVPADAEPVDATLPSEPTLVMVSGEEKSNFLTGATTLSFGDPAPLPLGDAERAPDWMGISGTGSDLYLLWNDGQAQRVDLAASPEPRVAESGRLVPEGVTITAQGFVLGQNTLAWGSDQGRLEAGFQIRREDFEGEGVPGMQAAPSADTLLVRTKELAEIAGDVRAVAASARTRLLLAAFGDQTLRLFNVTNASQLARVPLRTDAPVETIAFGPRENAVAVVTRDALLVGSLDPRYSEASFRALFRPAWYEGYAEPIHSWQSSSGTDDFEPKHSLMPLIFGTLKATFYSMLFGAPLALLAALYTSELLAPRVRSVIKPTIELMASLPSVVLGFLAALVFAPFVERVVPTTLASFVTFPLAFLLGAYAWQLLPNTVTLRLERFRFGFLILALPLGALLAVLIGPVAERLFFGGDIRAWLAWDASIGADQPQMASAIGGWLFLTVPLAAVVVWFLSNRYGSDWLRSHGADWDRRQLALADFVRFLIGLVATVGLALAAATLLDTLGFDPRGSYIDTYVQRNALIVGFVMGFAIIPIIYTIAEDALSTVPEHLRSASLGAGATRWQTAVRIILPTAASGLFSAVMIGLGRAVGETMIVLMAAGNTPVMEWNIFEGFRTLSANIAVELPEAVVGSTHYRTLFLAALVLFVMTFIVNTVAEVIRLRFRKRAYQL